MNTNHEPVGNTNANIDYIQLYYQTLNGYNTNVRDYNRIVGIFSVFFENSNNAENQSLNNLIESYNENFNIYQRNIQRIFTLGYERDINTQVSSPNVIPPATEIPPTRQTINNYTERVNTTRQYRVPRVVLTEEQIIEHTDMVIYDSSMESMTETSCPISIEQFINGHEVCKIRHCGHYFKKEPLYDWLKHYSSKCPVCRHNICPTTTTSTEDPPIPRTTTNLIEDAIQSIFGQQFRTNNTDDSQRTLLFTFEL